MGEVVPEGPEVGVGEDVSSCMESMPTSGDVSTEVIISCQPSRMCTRPLYVECLWKMKK